MHRWMEEVIFANKYNVKLENVTEQFNCLGLAGPKSRDILAEVTTTELSSKDFPFLHTRHFKIAGVPVRGIRISYTGMHHELANG